MKIFESLILSTVFFISFSATAQNLEGASSADFEKGFGENSGISNDEKNGADTDHLKIGGTLAVDATDTGIGSRDSFSNPATLWLYLDARLRNDIRTFVRLKGVVEPGLRSDDSDVEEMKLFFNVHKKVFFTVGKQKIKWGSGQFWNPTDVLNVAPRNLLYSDDRRSGVSLLKTHIPIGDANIYVVNSVDGATRLSEIGNSARVEVPVATSEFAFTVSKFFGQSAVWGADVSAGLGPLDLRGELAYSTQSNALKYGPTGSFKEKGASLGAVAGASYEMPYRDNDSVTFSLEYFRNADGYANKSDYVYPLAAKAYVPFHLAQDYAVLMLLAPQPGNWEHTTLSLSNIANISDGSFLVKLNAAFTLMQDLRLDVGVSAPYGDAAGEFRFLDQKYEVTSRLSVDF